MNRRLVPLTSFCAFLLLAGCITTPVAESGGRNAVTIPNTNAAAIASAARSVFARYGYSPGPGNFPSSISFDRPAGKFGHLMFGSYGRSTTFRVRLQILPLPGTNDFRIVPRVSRVGNARIAGFEDEVPMTTFWSKQFRPILRDIQAAAADAGPLNSNR